MLLSSLFLPYTDDDDHFYSITNDIVLSTPAAASAPAPTHTRIGSKTKGKTSSAHPLFAAQTQKVFPWHAGQCL